MQTNAVHLSGIEILIIENIIAMGTHSNGPLESESFVKISHIAYRGWD